MICIINIKIILYLLFINKAILLLIHVGSVKWGYMGNFDLGPNFTTNPMGSSGPLIVQSPVIWETFISNSISLPTLWGHLGHFGLGSIFHNYYNLNYELVP